MSTPAAIILASAAIAFTAWFLGLTRNGHRVVYLAWLILVAAHRLLISATGERALDQPAGVGKTVREMVLAGWWHVRNLAGYPRLWRAERQLRGCIATPLLSDPETLRSRADPEPEEVPVPESPRGRAPGTHPYPLRETAAQPALTEPANPARGYVPPASYTPYVAEYLP